MRENIEMVRIDLDLVYLGIPIRSTLDNSTTVQYAGLIMQLTNKARSTVSITSKLNSMSHHDVIDKLMSHKLCVT